MTDQNTAARCQGKQPFDNPQDAEKAARSERRRRGGLMEKYKCECGKWHIGRRGK